MYFDCEIKIQRRETSVCSATPVIPANVPKDQYFSLPRNSTTKSENRHKEYYSS